MKLTKLYIHNYKSFYDTTIELDKMNIVVGENNSGKSNLIDVLEFVDIILTKNFFTAFEEKGGWEKIYNYNNDELKMFIELELSNSDYLKKIRLTFHKEYFIETSSYYMKRNNSVLAIYIMSSRINLKNIKDRVRLFRFQKNINLLTNDFILKDILSTIEKKFTLSTYAFNTETIRNKSHRKAEKELQKNGSNLGQNLLHIKNNYPNDFSIISNSMIGVVNEIDGIEVQETFGNALIGFKEKNQDIGIDIVSDGTINFLATMTALNQPDNESILLAFDEPERYLHLKAVNYMLQAFRDTEKQILITTHSTEILKYANLEEIIFIYRDEDGDTQSIRADKVDGLPDMLKELAYERDLTLDELIADSIIGDFR